MTRTAIIAAMPGELKPLVRGWPHSTRNGVHFWAQRNEEDEWIAACAGAGQARRHPRLRRHRRRTAPSTSSSPSAGPERFTRHRSRHRPQRRRSHRRPHRRALPLRRGSRRTLACHQPHVADEAEKRRLASTYEAALVDMEAAAIARLAAMRGIPFYCIKGVSDGLTTNCPISTALSPRMDSFRPPDLLFLPLLRPWYWPALLRMGENSRRASQSIAESLLEFPE